jgi:hypothetical protein
MDVHHQHKSGVKLPKQVIFDSKDIEHGSISVKEVDV